MMPDLKKIQQSLVEHKVSESLMEQIMEGTAELPVKINKEAKAALISQVIHRMDQLLDSETSRSAIDWCACCKGGARDKDVKLFAKEHKDQSLAEKIIAIRKVSNMGTPKLNEDGTISTGILWLEGNDYRCPCPCFNGLKLKEPVPITYCYCCAGHFRYHFQNAFGVKLRTKEVVSSVLQSLGQKPCLFVYEIITI